jgi:hypothetical protein
MVRMFFGVKPVSVALSSKAMMIFPILLLSTLQAVVPLRSEAIEPVADVIQRQDGERDRITQLIKMFRTGQGFGEGEMHTSAEIPPRHWGN